LKSDGREGKMKVQSGVRNMADIAINVENLGKNFRIYEKPHHRLLQGLLRTRKYYRDFWALHEINLQISRGETVGIVGRNGSGKSTLLQIVCGTLAPTTGSISVNGRIAALLELGAGFNPEFTGRENAFLNASILGLTANEIEDRFESIEAFAEIGEFMEQPVKTYSSGMFVRLAFATAIHVEPKILVVDEALAVGDARFQAKCLNAIRKMKNDGVTILFVSHDVGSVRTLCDRSVWLDRGRLRMEGDVFPVTAQYTQFLFEDEESAEVKQGSEIVSVLEDESNDMGEGSIVPMEEARPINHWGTHIGAITYAGIHDSEGNRKDVFVNREILTVKIKIRVPRTVPRDTLSVAFSIKNIKGNDLIVSTTWDDKVCRFDYLKDEFEVDFEFENCLNTGKYLLVAALEDRAGVSIQYYEYVEGVQYFSTLFETEYFGVFLPHVSQRMLGEHGNSVKMENMESGMSQ
jgi:lipopolysaccharide transport system ATP-binding protein